MNYSGADSVYAYSLLCVLQRGNFSQTHHCMFARAPRRRFTVMLPQRRCAIEVEAEPLRGEALDFQGQAKAPRLRVYVLCSRARV